MPDKLKVTVVDAGSIRSAMAGEWGMADVEAACIVRQGHAPSMAMTMVGIGALKLLAPKKAKELPKKFVLAVTPDRVLAFDASSHGRGSDTSADTFHVTVSPGEIASWTRGEVSAREEKPGITKNATITLGGVEMPCAVPAGHAEEAFAELLSKLGAAPA